MYTRYVFSFTGHCRDRDTYAAVFGSLFISDHALDGASELREAIQNHAYGKMLLTYYLLCHSISECWKSYL